MSNWIQTHAVMQVTTGSISFLASLATAIMVKKSPGSLATPYRRVIFGLCSYDVLQSFALVSGPVLTPKVERYPWSFGNVSTCEFNGVMKVSGMIGVPIYTLLLCVYYLCKVKNSMSNEQFSKRIEIRTHIFVALLVICTSIAGVATKSFNALPGSSSCNFSAYPTGCRIVPELVGECTRGLQAHIFIYIFVYGLFALTIPCIIISVVMLCAHAIYKSRMFKANLPASSLPGNPRKHEHTSNSSSSRLAVSEEQDDLDMATRGARLAHLYAREACIQAVLYSTAFFTVYFLSFFLALANVFKLRNLDLATLHTSIAMLYPSGGFFNILIYSRPKVAFLHSKHPEFGWLQSLWLVLKAGTEVPAEEDLIYVSPWCLVSSRKGEVINNNSTHYKTGAYRNGDEGVDVEKESKKNLNSANVLYGGSDSISKNNANYRSELEWSHYIGDSERTPVPQQNTSQGLLNGE